MSADVARAEAAEPAWSVQLATVVETGVRVALGHQSDRDPWPVSRALTELGRQGAVSVGKPRLLGRGRGMPLIADYDLRWRTVALRLEALHHVRESLGEAALLAPSWDEMVAAGVDEASYWELVDVFCDAVDARFGAIVDGEPIDLTEPGHDGGWRARLGRHLGLLLPEGELDRAGADMAVYCLLPASGLYVLLR